MKLREFLKRSAATPAFREAVETFLRDPRPTDRFDFSTQSPTVKVLRTVTRLLEVEPDLAVERIRVEAQSGCEFFRGHLTVVTADGERRVRFHWDCKWKAMQLGWTDYFGFPDQARAAREFDHDCFREWEEVPVRLLTTA